MSKSIMVGRSLENFGGLRPRQFFSSASFLFTKDRRKSRHAGAEKSTGIAYGDVRLPACAGGPQGKAANASVDVS